MSGAHEQLEHAEHAEHAAHGGKTSKLIGVTMALIAALIAYCAALVGSERNELTRTMIEQTQAHADYTTASAKFRSVMLELEKQRAKMTLSTAGGASTDNSVDTKLVARFMGLAEDYPRERALTQKWADGFKPLIDAHFEGAEGYERAQLIAEFGIVLSSLAVLLGSRPIWLVSLVLSVCCIGQVVRVSGETKKVVGASLEQVEKAEESYKEETKARRASGQDEATLQQLDPDGKIRQALHEAREQREKAHEPAAAEAGEHK